VILSPSSDLHCIGRQWWDFGCRACACCGLIARLQRVVVVLKMRRKPQVGLIDMYCGMGMKVGGSCSSCIRTAHSRSAAPWAVALPLAGIVLGFGFAAVSGCALLAACAGVCTPWWPPVLWPPVHHKYYISRCGVAPGDPSLVQGTGGNNEGNRAS
jgi:hypothetical protein